jgi:hypothetical protein
MRCRLKMMPARRAAIVRQATFHPCSPEGGRNPYLELLYGCPTWVLRDRVLGRWNGSLDSLLIEPVIPFRLTLDWNLITRTIVPLIDQAPVGGGGGRILGTLRLQVQLLFPA